MDGLQKEANDFGWVYYTISDGCHRLEIVKDGFKSTGSQPFCVNRATRFSIRLERIAPPTTRLTISGQIFYQDGHPWRWKGITAFGLAHRYCAGEDIEPFLTAAKGFNLLRVFLYVEWPDTGWTAPEDECLRRFTDMAGHRGFYVELTLLTGVKPIDQAQSLVTHYFTLLDDQPNVLIELVNEPHLYGKPDTSQLAVPVDTHLLWTSGDYDPADRMHGKYGVAHTPRDNEWPRKAHDLFEYFHGGGPGTPADPPHAFPIVADEPQRPDQAGYVAADFAAYFGVSSLLGAGGTFHFESGKYGKPPTPQEADCAAAALKALDFYPADAPLGGYSHDVPDEQATGSLRSYKVGPYKVRVRPTNGDVLVPY
jgi:hypothetical protein